MTAATAGGLDMLGAMLGTGVAYLGFAAAFSDDVTRLLPNPLIHPSVIVIVLPAIAAGSGWLLAGAEPTTLAHRQLDGESTHPL